MPSLTWALTVAVPVNGRVKVHVAANDHAHVYVHLNVNGWVGERIAGL